MSMVSNYSFRTNVTSRCSSRNCRPLTESETKEYSNSFRLMDKDNDGVVSLSDLEKFLLSLGERPPKKVVQKLLSTADYNHDGVIDKQEFLQMMARDVNARSLVTPAREESFKRSFAKFDLNSDGYITRDELKLAFQRMGENLSDQEVDLMMIEATDQDRISFEDFRLMMLDDFY